MAHKKRFHQTAKDRRHESYGEKKRLGEDLYSGLNKARALERSDFHMISEDKHAVANMPQHVIQKEWPKSRNYHDYGLDDTIKGIDRQQNEDNAQMERHLQRGKY